MAALDRSILKTMGFAAIGENVQISDRASFYNCSNIVIGSNVRIDDFCILSAGAGGIDIGNYVHIAAYAALIGAGKICLEDFSNISARVSIYSSSDDYSGEKMTSPMVSQEFTGVDSAGVHIGRHAIIGAGSIVLPGVQISEGAAIGALSLVKASCAPFGVYVGTPAKKIAERKRKLLDLEKKFLLDRALK